MMPLSEVLAYRTTEDFLTAAEHLEAVAAHRESTFLEVRNRALRVVWEGVSADAMHEQVHWDYRHAAHSADDLRAAARVARDGAGDVDYAHRQMLYMLQDVQDDGYSVAEGYIVNDIKPSNNPIEQAQRAQKALEHSADLQYKATQFAETEASASARLQAAVAGEGKVQFVDHAFKQDGPTPTPAPPPQPPMSRKQAADGLKDVNDRIWTHNHVDKPVIDALPPNDPRRTDFHIETERLNAEKQQYLDVLPQQHPPANVIGPNGVNLPGTPPGIISGTPADNGQGWIYPVTPNQSGIDPRVVSIRVMEPTPQYPNGYLNYLNIDGQEVDPFTGRTVPPINPYAHIPLPRR